MQIYLRECKILLSLFKWITFLLPHDYFKTGHNSIMQFYTLRFWSGSTVQQLTNYFKLAYYNNQTAHDKIIRLDYTIQNYIVEP